MNDNQKSVLGWRVPVKAKDNFTAYCDKVGGRYEDHAGGCLFIWGFLPPDVQKQAILASKGIGEVDEKFWEIFGAGLEAALSGQPATPPRRRGK